MRLAAVLVLVAACRSDGPSASGTVTVTTYAGDQLAPGTRVMTSRPTGEVYDDQPTGALATETFGADPDSLVTAIFGTQALTTTVPASGELALHGPAPENTSILVVGVIDVNGPALAGATHYEIDVGCVTITTPTLPRTINVTACSLGADTNLDVLVSAYGPDLLGTAAARVPLIDEHAVFDVPGWSAPIAPPLTVEGIPAMVTATYYVDGNGYAEPMPDGVERSVLTADTGTARYQRYVPGVAPAMTIGAGDFLAPGEGDAVVYQTGEWTSVLPPGAPAPVPPQNLGVPTGDTVQLSVDSSDADGFDALQSAGLRTTTLVTLPADGTVRTTIRQ